MECMSYVFQVVLGAFLTVSGLVRVWREMRHMRYSAATTPAIYDRIGPKLPMRLSTSGGKDVLRIASASISPSFSGFGLPLPGWQNYSTGAFPHVFAKPLFGFNSPVFRPHPSGPLRRHQKASQDLRHRSLPECHSRGSGSW